MTANEKAPRERIGQPGAPDFVTASSGLTEQEFVEGVVEALEEQGRKHPPKLSAEEKAKRAPLAPEMLINALAGYAAGPHPRYRRREGPTGQECQGRIGKAAMKNGK